MNREEQLNNQPGIKENAKEQQSGTEENKIAENPNPRANENIKHTSFDTASESNSPASDVGSEITDGEGG